MALLWLIPPRGTPIPVEGERTLIGRHPVRCNLVLEHDTVSKEHVLIEQRGGHWVAIDQDSSNGTFVDGARIKEGKLREGSVLRIGQLEFKVRIVERRRGPAGPTSRRRPPSPAALEKPAAALPPPRKTAPPMQRTAPANVLIPAPAEIPAAPGKGPRGAAAELLGVKTGARPQEIQTRYHKLYNDYQIRLTNAPTPQLKRLYQKNLQELRAAYEMLCCPTSAS